MYLSFLNESYFLLLTGFSQPQKRINNLKNNLKIQNNYINIGNLYMANTVLIHK